MPHKHNYPAWVGEQHVAVTLECTANCSSEHATCDRRGTATMFLNGETICVKENVLVPSRMYRTKLYVGAYYDSQQLENSNRSGLWYKGTMRDLHVWDVALSASEVGDLHEAPVGVFPTSLRTRPPPIVSHYVSTCEREARLESACFCGPKRVAMVGL